MKTIIQILISFFIATPFFAQINIKSWAYQLQNISVSEISNNTSFDLIVIDYSQDGSDKNKFSTEDISQIKNSGKKVIAYISIGEAENYRKYWKENWDANNDGKPDSEAPDWLGNENPNWKGNYKVRYWNEEWQNMIFNYIDTIITQNFDGIYCDIIDGYYYWSEEIGEQPFADTLMIDFIYKIRNFVDSKTKNRFLIIPQNGEYIISENNITDNLKNKYFSAIDAIGIEDVFYFGDLDENNSYNPDNERLDILREFRGNNKTVLSIEYLTETNLINEYIEKAKENNFIPYVSVRSLNVLNNGIVLSNNDDNFISPYSFSLGQNYPNPFGINSPSHLSNTTINYSLSNTEPKDIRLNIYDILGRKILTLQQGNKTKGDYSIKFGTSLLNKTISNGLYFYQLQIGNISKTKKMFLMN